MEIPTRTASALAMWLPLRLVILAALAIAHHEEQGGCQAGQEWR